MSTLCWDLCFMMKNSAKLFMISVMLRRIGIDLIDNSLWWSDMIDFSCLSFRQVIFIYLPHHPRPPQSLIIFFFALTERILGNGWLSESNVSCLCCGTRISHITSIAQSCNQNSLTFKKWWMWVMEQMKRHVLPACRHKETLKGVCVYKNYRTVFSNQVIWLDNIKLCLKCLFTWLLY